MNGNDVLVVSLLVLAGFCAGGVWSAKSSNLPLAIGAGIACALALAAAVLRLV